jgi:lactate dehydrogenase-like 2-hydroxyacid dehydrogenase
MDELLRGSDVVSVHVPLSAETKGLLNAEWRHRRRRGPDLGSATRHTRAAMANLAARNVVLAGDPPITPVPR